MKFYTTPAYLLMLVLFFLGCSLGKEKQGFITDFEKNYFDAFSQMPLHGSTAAYKCVYILADTFSITEK